jgi:hypothetical protein
MDTRKLGRLTLKAPGDLNTCRPPYPLQRCPHTHHHRFQVALHLGRTRSWQDRDSEDVCVFAELRSNLLEKSRRWVTYPVRGNPASAKRGDLEVKEAQNQIGVTMHRG